MNFAIDLMIDLLYKLRGATWRSVWVWLTEDYGIRLIMLTVIIPVLLLAEHFGWSRY